MKSKYFNQVNLVWIASTFFLLFSAPVFSQENTFCRTVFRGNQNVTNTNAATTVAGSRGDDILYVQVVFHCLYNSPEDSIPAQKILEAFDELNKVYRRDVDMSLINPVFHSRAADAKIQFCLAELDPNGEATSGIVYKKTNLTHFPAWDEMGVDAVKVSNLGGVDPWDTNRYLNIWIANLSDDLFYGGYGIPWFGYLPLGVLVPHNAVTGVVLSSESFYPTSVLKPEHLVPHEIGHTLGLKHTHGDPNGPQEFCETDDEISDTPKCSITGFDECGVFSVNSCIEAVNDEPDNIENIMSYSCSKMITTEQVNRIYANLLLPGAPSIFSLIPCGSPLATNETPSSADFVIQPNPCKGQFEVSIQGFPNEKTTIQLFDLSGKLLFTDDMQKQGFYRFNGNLPSGMYFCKIQGSGLSAIKRVIVL